MSRRVLKNASTRGMIVAAVKDCIEYGTPDHRWVGRIQSMERSRSHSANTALRLRESFGQPGLAERSAQIDAFTMGSRDKQYGPMPRNASILAKASKEIK